METTFYSLASKTNFNKALRHFFKVNDVVDAIEGRKNLADFVNDELDAEELVSDQILPIIGAIIRDKFGYSYDSFSIPSKMNDFSKISNETAKWTALDLVCVYFNPNGKIQLANPKNADHWDRLGEISLDQLMVIYAKYQKGDNKKLELEAITSIEEMIAGKDVFINKDFIDQTMAVAAPKPAPKPAAAEQKKAPSAGKNVTPRYAVRVSNELFHNGNVEAWKKIIESFNHTYPELQVNIFHEGELINDINALFKWGKVKGGDAIFFQVAGDAIKGVAKLQKYLYEGASPRYEQFLKIGLGQVLQLF